jgi:hypothetical protein
MEGILNVGKDLVDEIRLNCKPELLKEIFNLRTADWKYHQMSVEGGTVDIFGDLQNFNYSSFDLIPAAIEIVLGQQDSELFATALSLLCVCIEQSDTTQVPAELSEKWELLESKVNKLGNTDSVLFWNGICKWYRVNPNHS